MFLSHFSCAKERNYTSNSWDILIIVFKFLGKSLRTHESRHRTITRRDNGEQISKYLYALMHIFLVREHFSGGSELTVVWWETDLRSHRNTEPISSDLTHQWPHRLSSGYEMCIWFRLTFPRWIWWRPSLSKCHQTHHNLIICKNNIFSAEWNSLSWRYQTVLTCQGERLWRLNFVWTATTAYESHSGWACTELFLPLSSTLHFLALFSHKKLLFSL